MTATYPFVKAGAPDYGARKGPALGLMLHMAEGGGTVGYLSRKPPRGVSVHAVCDVRGIVTQMLPWERASGSLNPADRSTDKAYFGQQHLMDVLGSWWTDPNSAVLSMEIEGFAAKGPTKAQVDAAIAWGLDMRDRFPTLRGALGHADQTNTKGCPGTTAAMQAVFAGVGGHGLWHEASTNAPAIGGDMLKISSPTPALIDLPKDAQLYDLAFAPLVKVSGPSLGQVSPYEVEQNANSHYRVARASIKGIQQIVLIHDPDANVRAIPTPTAPPAFDVDANLKAEHERTLQEAIDALGALKASA